MSDQVDRKQAPPLPFALPQDEASRDRLAELGQLASGLVHELKNPLGAIVLNVQLLQDQCQRGGLDRAKVAARLDRIAHGTHQLDVTIASFLAFARPGRPDRTRVDVNQLLEQILEEQAELLESAGIGVAFHSEEALHAVPADRSQLRSVFLNIILNASDALRLNPADRQRHLLVATRNRGKRISVVIANNGPPLSEKAAAHLFEPFFSEKEDGTGLGLAIVRRIVELHRGKVSASSDPTQGVSFTIELPTTLGPARGRKELPTPQIRTTTLERVDAGEAVAPAAAIEQLTNRMDRE